MKDPQILISIFSGIVYMIVKFIRAVHDKQAKSLPPTESDWKWKTTDCPVPKQELPPPTQPAGRSILTLKSQPSPINTPIYRKLMVTPSYPGIKKLVLPTQEQDPYKLYQKAYPKKLHQLHYLLSKYSTNQQAIIMHEIFTPKGQVL